MAEVAAKHAAARNGHDATLAELAVRHAVATHEMRSAAEDRVKEVLALLQAELAARAERERDVAMVQAEVLVARDPANVRRDDALVKVRLLAVCAARSRGGA